MKENRWKKPYKTPNHVHAETCPKHKDAVCPNADESATLECRGGYWRIGKHPDIDGGRCGSKLCPVWADCNCKD